MPAFTHITQNGVAHSEKVHPTYEQMGSEREMADDIFDETYREKEGPKPAKRYVWRNIILMAFLHLTALYAIWFIPSAKLLTLAWGKLKLPSFTLEES